LPEYNVTLVITADDGDDAARQVGEWVVTPGTVLMGIHSAQPEVVHHQPMRISKGGKIGKINRTRQQPQAVPSLHRELPPGEFPNLVPVQEFTSQPPAPTNGEA
jgi:hypothetical protein